MDYKILFGVAHNVCFDATGNDNDVFVIEQWAQESLLVLEESMIAASMVYRDYEDKVARHGETVTAWVPGTFFVKRKTDDDSVTKQAAKSVPISVVLNQHLHVSFVIKDGEESKSFKSLRDEYIAPAATALAKGLDEIVLTQVYRFSANAVGQLGVDPGEATVIDLDTLMNQNLVPMSNRNLLLCPRSKGSLLKVDAFKHADKRGDGGEAMRKAEIGEVYNLNTYLAHNVPSIVEGAVDIITGLLVNNAAGYAVGTKTLTVDGLASAIVSGSWCLIDGDDRPRRIVSSAGGATPTSITLETGIDFAVEDNASITIFKAAAINDAAGDFDAGWVKEVTYDGITKSPLAGQMVSVGATGATYALVGQVTATTSLFDIPLSADVADNDVMGIGPTGSYNFAFHRNALALVTRPLAAPAKGAGALSYVANYNDLSIRVTITYNGDNQGHLVTLDLLCGVKVLNTDLGAVMYGK